MVSRCFPGGYNVKLYISRGRLAWWLLAFLCCVVSCCPVVLSLLYYQTMFHYASHCFVFIWQTRDRSTTNATKNMSHSNALIWNVMEIGYNVGNKTFVLHCFHCSMKFPLLYSFHVTSKCITMHHRVFCVHLANMRYEKCKYCVNFKHHKSFVMKRRVGRWLYFKQCYIHHILLQMCPGCPLFLFDSCYIKVYYYAWKSVSHTSCEHEQWQLKILRQLGKL